MPARISALVAKLKRENPELSDSPILDQIEQAAYDDGGDEADMGMGDEMGEPGDESQPGPMDEEFDMGDMDDEMMDEPPPAAKSKPKAKGKGLFGK